jgi:uroporphyrinogen decarboxylase
MRPREAVLQAFNLEVPERPSVTLIGGGSWTIFNSGSTIQQLASNPEKLAEVLISFSKKINSDIVYCGSGYANYVIAALGGKLKFKKVGPPDIIPLNITDLEQINKLNISNLENNIIIENIWKSVNLVYEKLSDKYLIAIPTWGPFTIASHLRGVEGLIMDLHENKKMVHHLMKFALEIDKEYCKPLLEDGLVEAILLADPVASGDLINKKSFDTFVLPYLIRLNKYYKKYDIKTILHICGDTTDRLDSILKSKYDCFSLDSKVDLTQAKNHFAGKITFAGNIDPVRILEQNTPKEVESAVIKCLDIAYEDGGYILSPGCDIPPTVPMNNLQAFFNTALDYKFAG